METHLTECSSDVWARVEREWQALAEKKAPALCFLGGTWVRTWLASYGDTVRPLLLTTRSSGELVGTCLLSLRNERRGPIPVRCLYLNTAGEPSGSGVCAEYNQVLCADGSEAAVALELGRAVQAQSVDEVVAQGSTEEGLALLRSALPGWREEIERSDDAFVDFEELRRSGADYQAGALSRNSRTQLRRALRAYEETGPLAVEIASTAVRAVSMLDELIELHQSTWKERGMPGAFASPRHVEFHRDFIDAAFEAGTIQIARVTAGDEVIGILYCFADRGKIFFYQSGLHYREGKMFRPGLVAHACLIEHNFAEGALEYHFLAGDETTPRYKKSLSNSWNELAWVHFERPGFKNRTIRALRGLKRRLDARKQT